MKLTTVTIAFAYGLVPVTALSLFHSSEAIIDDNLDVPGESPLKFCTDDRSDDIISIHSVDLVPNPPQAGAELVIKATGTVYEPIVDGAYVDLQVKYGLIRLISTRADLCEQIKNVDLECPIEKGVISIMKSVELPKEVPPGKYTVSADVVAADGKHITCLTAQVVFGRRDSIAPSDL